MDVTEYGYAEVPIPRLTRFWFLLIFDIPAVVFTISLLYTILFKPNLRKALHNHVIIVSFVISLLNQAIGIVFYMTYSIIGQV